MNQNKIILSEFISLDGVMEGPGPVDAFEHAGWTIPFFNDDIAKYKLNELVAAGSLVLGRVTYKVFASTWPKMTDKVTGTQTSLPGGFATRMNSIQKYVVSTTLKPEDVTWQNSTLISSHVIEEIKKLKTSTTGDLLLVGSGTLAQTLIQNDLIDEFRLLVYPIILGKGKRLFTSTGLTSLELAGKQDFTNGVTALHYRLHEK